MRLNCTSKKCEVPQILDLLASLNETPYLVAIDELEFKCDPKKRKEFELDIMISTFTLK